ncbi:uncharacterized protein LOC111271175 [Varroa jacobsoni]|uniref:uncharacterized protein LOC111271175 n=1 Tax=Varroa jacobsoni TaxID=62625 RepID=UPI000BF490EB|nr:uncharacterized protein LOC111271175 [Varroa jacobsoni]XP_022707532.1 uncharacterized protein LOC111271175 [Varroa jacobsoni]
MEKGSCQQNSPSTTEFEESPNKFAVADKAFCRFLLTLYRERPRWKSLQNELAPLWAPLCDYEQMYTEVTAENAEKVFGTPGVLNEDALRNLKRKLDIARHNEINKPKTIITEMKSVLNSVRNARVQLSYDLAGIDLAALDTEDNEKGKPSSHLRSSYVKIIKDCDDVIECLWQDLSEVDSILNSFENHFRWHGAVMSSRDLDHIKENFSERSAQLLCPLRCYMEFQGIKLDKIKAKSSMLASSDSCQTPKSSRQLK